VTILRAVALLAVAGGGTAVVLTRDPTRQVIVTGFFGLLLAVLFFVLQAPDVALSQIVVGGVAVPVMALLTLAKLRERTREREKQ
jgi:energy-converting hydrogenase B subunit D